MVSIFGPVEPEVQRHMVDFQRAQFCQVMPQEVRARLEAWMARTGVCVGFGQQIDKERLHHRFSRQPGLGDQGAEIGYQPPLTGGIARTDRPAVAIPGDPFGRLLAAPGDQKWPSATHGDLAACRSRR